MSSSSASLFPGLTEPLSPSSATAVLPAELQAIQSATRRHQAAHGCSAHTFEDGEGLWRLVAALAPRRVLEFGTGLGYTACLMAWASPQAQVDTLEGDAAHAALARSDAMLVAGSSLMVFSGYRFVLEAVRRGLPVAAVNQGRTRADDLLTLKMEQDVGAALQAVTEALQGP